MNHAYCGGIPGIGAFVVLVSPITTRPIKYRSDVAVRGRLMVRGTNLAFAASGARRMMGNCEWSIHPCFQSIFGWVAANQGYPSMILFSPNSDRKKRRLERCVPVCTCKSV